MPGIGKSHYEPCNFDSLPVERERRVVDLLAVVFFGEEKHVHHQIDAVFRGNGGHFLFHCVLK
jgi:hypothetical protein